jgi:hypothetical protein
LPGLRAGFDDVAEPYDRIRPKYPAPLFEEPFSQLPEQAEVV